ncbi:ankyrin repeat domain-containing protein [Streptomyces sp. MB22_4]|uniref:ankyrin repeat domain-containing protein n=1 Tax=Streptomyces sp. MB22_4 TaxID=3383120 RepID=UPI0039A2205C
MCVPDSRRRARGPTPRERTREGTTPLSAASVSGRTEIALLLRTAGAHPDPGSAGPGAEGTPLCAAACRGHAGTVRALPAHGADPDPRGGSRHGPHPLERALARPHAETADRLTAAGAV